jgi:hypothetical protein
VQSDSTNRAFFARRGEVDRCSLRFADRSYGRWLSLAVLVLWLGFELYQQPNPFYIGQDNCGNGPLHCFEYSNREQMIGGMITRVLIYVFLLILILRMAFANSIKIFFQEKEKQLDAPADL